MAADRTERLLNLVLCLLGAARPVSRANLRSAVPSYQQAPSDEAFERMFERDKDELRGMGVPVETIVNPAGEVEGYRIEPEAYAMPELSLTASELALLGLAAQAWSDAAVAAPAVAALRKVEAVAGGDYAVDATQMLAGRSTGGEAELPTLWEAIRTSRVVTFHYLSLSDTEPRERTVEPWATVMWQGAWYLAGWSPERGEARVYRLSRIHGFVKVTSQPSSSIDPGDVRDLVARLAEPDPVGEAIVAFPEGRGGHLAWRGRPGSDGTYVITYSDAAQFVGEVLASEGTIVAPQGLRDQARSLLERVVTTHAETGHG